MLFLSLSLSPPFLIPFASSPLSLSSLSEISGIKMVFSVQLQCPDLAPKTTVKSISYHQMPRP